MTTPAPQIADMAAVKLDRLDAEIASLEAKKAAKERERSDLAARWGYDHGYRMRVSPDQMRAVVRAGE